MIWQQGWVWMVAGLVLAIAETVLPGFILLGFAVGAVVTGVLVWVGLIGGAGLPVVLLVFAVASALGWWGLRKAFGVRGGKPKIWTRDINEN